VVQISTGLMPLFNKQSQNIEGHSNNINFGLQKVQGSPKTNIKQKLKKEQ